MIDDSAGGFPAAVAADAQAGEEVGATLRRVHDGSTFDQLPRELFVAFLERFANGDVDREQWQQWVVNHYLDEMLERIRQDCVRLRMSNEPMRWSTEEHDRIQAWIRALRA